LIDIYADDVILDGFTLMDSSYASYNTAVHIEGNNTGIVNNRIIDIGSGVFIAGSDNNNIANNEFEKSGVVISIVGDNTNTVSGNTVNSMPLEFHENVADLVIDYPVGQIILVDCVNVTMQDLVISETSIGIQMKDCVDCCISNCDINSCFDGNILISYSEDCIVRHNDIHSSYEEGIYLINTRNVTLELNNFYLNRMAILSEYTTLNRYVNNNFANNGFCVFSVIGTLNTWDHNYWNRARIFPKFIFEFPRIVLDRNPAKTPN
jgi:parallel beta-helix repeat protein